MSRPDLNELARKIAAKEGGKKQVNIAQIKEVMRCHMMLLARDHTDEEILEVVKFYRKQVDAGLMPEAEF